MALVLSNKVLDGDHGRVPTKLLQIRRRVVNSPPNELIKGELGLQNNFPENQPEDFFTLLPVGQCNVYSFWHSPQNRLVDIIGPIEGRVSRQR